MPGRTTLRYDLHSHSTASDGVLSPSALVERAARVGLDGLALTDHDCVDGIPAALAAAADLGIELIPGIELSVQVGERDIHVLGLWIEHEDTTLRRVLAELSGMRRDRAGGMVARLRELGHAIEMEDVLAQSGDGNPGRPHVAKAMVARGIVASLEEAFERYIGDDGPAYVPKSLMGIDRGFELFRTYRAVPVFAHPGLCDYEPLLDPFIARGLKGLEVDHPKHNPPERERLRRLCRERGLVPSGGSDFHHPGAASRELGVEGVNGETLAALRAQRPGGLA